MRAILLTLLLASLLSVQAAETAAPAESTDWRAELKARLARKVTLEIHEADAESALAILESETKLELVVDPRIARLPDASRAFTFRAADEPLYDVLVRLVAEAGLALDRLDGKPFVTHPTLPRGEKLGFFDVRDLAPGDSREKSAAELLLAADRAYSCCPHLLENEKAYDRKARDLVRELRERLAPESWKDAKASAEIVRGMLVVSQRGEVIAQVRPYLEGLRQGAAAPDLDWKKSKRR
ncbi:MAG: hypothetical protein M5U26_06065 [Planctomycetota bacterium]|nr:hypothetical protein [Planctomycetota bacterium]